MPPANHKNSSRDELGEAFDEMFIQLNNLTVLPVILKESQKFFMRNDNSCRGYHRKIPSKRRPYVEG